MIMAFKSWVNFFQGLKLPWVTLFAFYLFSCKCLIVVVANGLKTMHIIVVVLIFSSCLFLSALNCLLRSNTSNQPDTMIVCIFPITKQWSICFQINYTIKENGKALFELNSYKETPANPFQGCLNCAISCWLREIFPVYCLLAIDIF